MGRSRSRSWAAAPGLGDRRPGRRRLIGPLLKARRHAQVTLREAHERLRVLDSYVLSERLTELGVPFGLYRKTLEGSQREVALRSLELVLALPPSMLRMTHALGTVLTLRSRR